MAFHWLTPKEKKQVRAMRKKASLEEIEALVYGDRSIVMSLKASLDRRVHPLLDRMTRARINPRTQSLEAVAGFSDPMQFVISLLRMRPHTMSEVTAELTRKCSLSASTAQRDAYALVSILTVCDRAQRVGPSVELK